MRYVIIPLLVVSTLVGCTKEPTSTVKPAPQATAVDVALVTVNGKTLNRADAQIEVDTRLAGMAKNDSVPQDRLAATRDRMLRHVVDQFVMRTLLLEEADLRGITVTPEDEQEAFSKIAEALPDGKTPEQVMQESPLGEERMRDEVLTGIRINKLLAKAMPETSEAGEEEIAKFKEENAERLAIPETAKARHILIKTTAEDTDEQKSAKRAEADAIHKQLAEGADFAELAREHSDCPSADKGGDLGTFSRGRMVKAFEDAAFSQDIGALGPVVETQFGYHIIEVLQLNPAGTLSDEKVVQLIQARKRQDALRELLEDLKAKADIVANQ